MFKLVVLLSVAAMTVANPSVVVPGVGSVSQYGSSIVHGSPAVYSPAVYSAYGAYGTPAVVPVHHLYKRSIAVAALGYAAVAPVVYSPVVTPYSARLFPAYSAPILASTYPGVYPRALSVHPY